MPVFKAADVIKFKQNCYSNNIPNKTTMLTGPHLIIVNSKRNTAAKSVVSDSSVRKKNKYIDYFYHIHVDSPNIYEYALVNDMYCDVWGNAHEYTHKYSDFAI